LPVRLVDEREDISVNDPDVTLGESLLRRLDETGLAPAAAYWLLTELGYWRLDLRIPQMDDLPRPEAAQRVQAVIGDAPGDAQFALLAEDEHRLRALRETISLQDDGVRIQDSSLAGIHFSDCYVLRLS
jgi:hypothetical protein